MSSSILFIQVRNSFAFASNTLLFQINFVVGHVLNMLALQLFWIRANWVTQKMEEKDGPLE